MDKVLDIKNLRVSFRANEGIVRAVRDIDLELYKGETLAIVGESGSGKSVTAKAILGLLAPNSIVESGEIIFDGKDLLKVTEDEFHSYRGNRLSMIFQDPMSSLNPIMRIGKQLTEAMILNGKANQREAKKEYKLKINLLKENLQKAGINNVDEKFNILDKIIKEGIQLEKAYNEAYHYASDASYEIKDLLVDIINGEPRDIREQIKYIIPQLKKTYNDYVVKAEESELTDKIKDLTEAMKAYKAVKDQTSVSNILEDIVKILDEAVALPKPDFLAMSYYMTYNKNTNAKVKDIAALNKVMKDFMDRNFLDDFKSVIKKAIEYSYKKSLEAKREAIKVLEANISVFESKWEKDACTNAAKSMSEAVNNSIDRLAIKKESATYTFSTSIMSAVEKYFSGIISNKKNLARYEKENAKLEKLKAKGKVTHKVTPAELVDLELIRSDTIRLIKNLIELYKDQVKDNADVNFSVLADEMVQYLEKKALAMAYKVTPNTAKNRAIKLMKEVGIPQPRKRFNQFPFHFSGGMRQRIVIAIALAANPDILICDEPTTALDVTIQAQILELIKELKEERQLSVIFITHDLGVVANMADRIAVMYAGKIVEIGTADEIFYEPAHPYTWALLASMPDLDTKEKLEAIPGTPPNMIFPPIGDAFAARNKYAMQIDFEEQPPLFKITPTHYAATWLLHPNAPKVEPPRIVTERIERMRKMNMEVAENA